MESRKRIFRFVAYAIEILIFYIVQGIPNLIPEVFGGRPVLLLSIAITIAVFESQISAMAFGLVCGAMLDFGTGVHFGFYTFALTIVCFFLGYFSENYFNTKLSIVALISLGLIPVLVSLNFLISCITNDYGSFYYYYVHHILAIMAYTYVTIPIFYIINKTISHGFSDNY
jgi:rod shape-determining protein MreD